MTSLSSAPPRHRYLYLDGVRGCAALMVALSHFILALHPAMLGGTQVPTHFAAAVALSHSPLVAFYNPQLGVTIFFVLSGFVLAASVADRPAWFPELAMRRWLRLALPILGSSLLVWPLARYQLFYNGPAATYTKSDWLAGNYLWIGFEPASMVNLVFQSFIDIFARAKHAYNPALWTMPIEFWGSLILFAGYALLPGVFAAREGGLLIGAFAVALLWQTRYAGFAYGLLLFEAMRAAQRLPPATLGRLATGAPWAGVGLLGAGILAGGMPYALNLPEPGLYEHIFLLLGPMLPRPVELLHDLGATMIVAGVLLWRPAQHLLERPLFVYLGRISFMLYLVHVPVLCSLISWLVLRLVPLMGYNRTSLLLLVVFYVTVIVLADLATRAFDEPAIRLSRQAGQALTACLRRG